MRRYTGNRSCGPKQRAATQKPETMKAIAITRIQRSRPRTFKVTTFEVYSLTFPLQGERRLKWSPECNQVRGARARFTNNGTTTAHRNRQDGSGTTVNR